MTVKFRLLGWSAKGLRCPDHEVLLGDNDSPSPIVLLQMPNGTGKTTTLNLLRAALSGSAASWTPPQVDEYRKKGQDASSGVFTLRARFGASTITIKLTLDFAQGRASYLTTLGTGQMQGFHPPQALSRYLKPSFVTFFVFDGELAERLLSSEDGSAEAVVEELFQLKHFRHIGDQVRDYWSRKVAGRGAQEEKGLTRRLNRSKTLQERLKRLRREYGVIERELANTKKQLETKKSSFDKALQDQQADAQKLSEAERALNAARERVREQRKVVLQVLRDPYALGQTFAAEMIALKASFDRVKLPETAAKEFFEELAQERECICGRPLDTSTRKALRDRASQYLGADEVNVLNAIKSDIGAHIAGPEAGVEVAQAEVQRLIDANREESSARTNRDAVQDDVSNSRPELRDAREDIEALSAKVTRLEAAAEKYLSQDDSAGDDSDGIVVIEKRLKDAEEDVAEITNTLDLRAKRDVLQSVLAKAHAIARERLCGELRDEANRRVSELMPYNGLRITQVGRSLELEGQTGASRGEALSVAYAFLSTLFNRSEHVLPFVVDSPANPIDLAVRKKVAALVPRLGEQFVAFTISSERAGFLEPLEKVARDKIMYATVLRKGIKELDGAAKKCRNRKETADGIVVYDRDFFLRFHLDEEESGK